VKRNLAVARRYAKALLLIGKEDGQAETYRDELARFADAMAQNPELEEAVLNPLYDDAGRKRVLEAAVKKLGLSRTLTAFLSLLFDKGRLDFIHGINEFYQGLADELKGVARASLVSATDLNDDAVEKIRDALSRRTGKVVKLDVQTDPELIGGLVTRIGDMVLDGSIRTQLQNMKETLKRGESA
jgi:F-type H+-transporting ATPase subunit delta